MKGGEELKVIGNLPVQGQVTGIKSDTLKGNLLFENLLQNAAENLGKDIFLGINGDMPIISSQDIAEDTIPKEEERIIKYNLESLNFIEAFLPYRPIINSEAKVEDMVFKEARENESQVLPNFTLSKDPVSEKLVFHKDTPIDKPQEKFLIKEDIREIKIKEQKNPLSIVEESKEFPKAEKNERIPVEVEFQEVIPKSIGEKVIIPLSDESSQVRTSVMSQIKEKILINVEKGENQGIRTVTMELEPKHLGKVDIKIIFEENSLRVEIKAAKEETQKIISSGIDELKDLLSKGSQDIKIIVSPEKYYQEPKNTILQHLNNRQGHENFYGNFDGNSGQRQEQYQRQRSNYYNNIRKKEDIFSELVKLSTVEGG